MQEMQIQSLGGEDPLEKETATHPSVLAWEIPWTEEPGGLQSMGSQRAGHDWATNSHFRLPVSLNARHNTGLLQAVGSWLLQKELLPL